MPRQKIPAKKYFAFWNHDLFPFILGGRVTKIYAKEREGMPMVHTYEYGSSLCYGRYFTTKEKGEQLKKDLASLKRNRADEIDAIDRIYRLRLDETLKRAGIKRKK